MLGVRTAARGAVPRARRLVRRLQAMLEPEQLIDRIEIVVMTTESSPSDCPTEPTSRSIETARNTLFDLGAAVTDRRRRSHPAVTVHAARPGWTAERLPVGDGTLWLFLVNGAELAADALVRLVDVFEARPDLDLAYGDAGVADRAPGDEVAGSVGPSDPETVGPWLLPGFSPHRLADQFYLGHLVAVRPSRLVDTDTVGPARITGPQSLAAGAATVAHIPAPLHTPAPPPGDWPAPVRPAAPARQEVRSWPLVSVIVPTNGSQRELGGDPTVLVDGAVRSVVASTYPRIEVIIVATPGTPPDLIPGLERLDRVSGLADDNTRSVAVVTDDRPFNFSNACNHGAVRARGDVLVFLNDDTEVIADDWLNRLVAHARTPEVGAVGARLLYQDGRVQHSGIWTRGGHPTHRYEGYPGDAVGYRRGLAVTQNCLAVSGACLAVERSKFDAVGGFSPVFPSSYNDVDLCLKLLDRGWVTVIEPRAELYHYEASSRDPSISDADLAALHDRWRWRINHDPFDNPNHRAERSEELPLPGGLTVGGGHGTPRFWPLEPVGRPPGS